MAAQGQAVSWRCRSATRTSRRSRTASPTSAGAARSIPTFSTSLASGSAHQRGGNGQYPGRIGRRSRPVHRSQPEERPVNGIYSCASCDLCGKRKDDRSNTTKTNSLPCGARNWPIRENSKAYPMISVAMSSPPSCRTGWAIRQGRTGELCQRCAGGRAGHGCCAARSSSSDMSGRIQLYVDKEGPAGKSSRRRSGWDIGDIVGGGAPMHKIRQGRSLRLSRRCHAADQVVAPALPEKWHGRPTRNNAIGSATWI